MKHLTAHLRLKYLAAGLCLAIGLEAVGLSAQPPRWEPVGLSGGGGMFTPSISPVNPNLIMLNCDMSAAYLSEDGGHNWRMIHHAQLRSDTACRPAFHPTDANIIYASSGGRLKISRDRGKTFTPIGNLKESLSGEIAISPMDPRLMLAGSRSGRCWFPRDAGETWAACPGPTGRPIAFHFDRTRPGRVMFAATDQGIWRSDDGGATWQEKTQGIYRSRDRGETWVSAMGRGLNTETQPADPYAFGPISQYRQLLAADAKPLTVYAFNTATGFHPPHSDTVYRSDDGGDTWRATYFQDPRFKDYNEAVIHVTTFGGSVWRGPAHPTEP
jgi:hypothetical protein